MDGMERSKTSLRKENKFWHIPLLFFSNHLNGITRLKTIDPQRVLMDEEDKVHSWLAFWVCRI